MAKDLVEFTGFLEKRLSDSIREVSGHHWDEDYITRKLLSELNDSLASIELQGEDSRQYVDWETYKLRGTYEKFFGDISLVVNISYKDGTSLSGVAFLEAKRRDWRKTTFSAMNKLQLKRILKRAPRAQYLLYDYEDITGFPSASIFGYEVRHYRIGWGGSITEKTNSLCVPLNIAAATGFKDTLLYRHGIPFSLMLANRYFQGLDLEFDQEAKDVATGFLKKFGLPKYVLRINITEHGADVIDEQLELNLEEYEKLEQS